MIMAKEIAMRWLWVVRLALLPLTGMFVVGTASAQATKDAAKDIVGMWSLVSATVDRDGNKSEPLGASPKGLLVFDRNGRFSLIAARADLPKFASNNRTTGSPEENKAVVRGSVAYFGTYTVSEADRMLVLHVESATFPNWVGTDQKRIFAINGDQLRYTIPNRSGGEGTALVIWKRMN